MVHSTEGAVVLAMRCWCAGERTGGREGRFLEAVPAKEGEGRKPGTSRTVRLRVRKMKAARGGRGGPGQHLPWEEDPLLSCLLHIPGVANGSKLSGEGGQAPTRDEELGASVEFSAAQRAGAVGGPRTDVVRASGQKRGRGGRQG